MSTNTPVFGLFQYDPATDGNLPFNITQALNNNWNAIDSLALPAAAAASPYNPSGTYAIGDFCIYNGTLQKCNTPILSGEAWNRAHWTATTVAAELTNSMMALGYNISDLSNMPIKPFIASTLQIGATGLPEGWPNTRTVVARFCVPGSVYQVDLIGSYVLKKFALRITDGEWKEIVTATPPQVRNLTLQSGFTANGDCTFFVTQESAVFLAGGVSGTLPANQDTQIGTLPSDACPSKQRRRPAVTNAGAAYIDIHTDGTVWAHPFAAASQCWFECSFVAGGGS